MTRSAVAKRGQICDARALLSCREDFPAVRRSIKASLEMKLGKFMNITED